MESKNITFDATFYIIVSSGNCVICGRKHTKVFPEGFPDKWKMCCFCLNFAYHLVYANRRMVEETHKDFPYKPERVIKNLDDIEKLINLRR